MNTDTRTYDLPCYDTRKSFYGKARVIETTGPYKTRTLQSYNTNVCTIDDHGKLTKLSPVATPTTRRHIRSFLRHCGYAEIKNADWDKLPLHFCIVLEDIA